MARIAGTKNKNKDRLLRQIQEEFPNYNGLIELLKIANSSETSTSEKINCHTTVCKYIYPALKAVEYKASIDVMPAEPLSPLKDLFDKPDACSIAKQA